MGNGWDDKRSYIEEIANKRGSIIGQYFLNDIQFNFSFARQSKGEYLMRGRCVVISPHDGHVLQVQGAERRERIKRLEQKGVEYDGKKRLEALNASSAMYCRTADIDDLKELIERKALDLYGNNALAINETIEKTAPAHSMHSAQAVRLYSKKFLSSSKASTKTIETSKNDLVRIGAYFDSCPMSEIKQKDIRKYADDMGASAEKKLRLARRFWDYCRAVGLFSGDNPFDLFFKRNSFKKGKDTKAIQNTALLLQVLPFDVEAALNKRIMDNLSDGRYIGIALVKGGRPVGKRGL